MAADKSTPRDNRDDADDQEAIRAIMEYSNVDEATARELWEQVKADMQSVAANR